jgi:hypothetical protein
MKKSFFFILTALALSHYLGAQKVITNKNIKQADTVNKNLIIKNDIPALITSAISPAPNIIVYEQTGYRGRTASFIKNAEGKFEFPFSVSNASIKIPPGVILYIKYCTEFESETGYSNSVRQINLEGICGVRTDEAVKIVVSLAGISTEIHNPDCMRFAGKIEAKILETSPTGVEAVLPGTQVYWNRPNYSGYSTMLFDRDVSLLSNRNYHAEYTNRTTVYNNNPVPILRSVMAGHTDSLARNRLRGNPNYSPIATYLVGKSALRDGRLKLWIKTDLISAHKTCGTCDDFSSKIKMENPGFITFPLQTTNYNGQSVIVSAPKYFVAGPYQARGSRDGFAITATSGTTKNFRVHLIVEGL